MSRDAFPYNVVYALEECLGTTEGVNTVVRRPLRPTDPNGTLGVFAKDWVPGQGAIGQRDPMSAQYLYGIQFLLKHTDEVEGNEMQARISKSLRAMLYRDTNLQVRLGQLTETSFGVRERMQQWGISRQRFLSNEVQGQFIYLSTLDFWVEVEIV